MNTLKIWFIALAVTAAFLFMDAKASNRKVEMQRCAKSL